MTMVPARVRGMLGVAGRGVSQGLHQRHSLYHVEIDSPRSHCLVTRVSGPDLSSLEAILTVKWNSTQCMVSYLPTSFPCGDGGLGGGE